MCGIVGYVGAQQAAPILLEGLQKLEYRGYDSAGIAVLDGSTIELAKACGEIKNLLAKTHDGSDLHGYIGLGHTRWATHGAPTEANAHPHVSNDGKFAIVQNGIIENFMELREMLQAKGFRFHSETDTEVIVHLLDMYYTGDGNLKDTVMKTLGRLEGSYAIGILCADCPEQMFLARNGCPLIIGVGAGENFFASDVTALVSHTKNVVYLDDGELAEVRADGYTVFDCTGKPVHKPVSRVAWDIEAAEKGGYEHFMLKEIMEQPRAIKSTLDPRVKDHRVVFDELKMTDEQLMALTSDELLARIRSLSDYEHYVMYYGPETEAKLIAALDAIHRTSQELKPVRKVRFPLLTVDKSEVNVAQYDAKQIYYLQYSNRGEKFSTDNDPGETLFNSYFGGGMYAVVFQEMREARSLAYTAFATFTEMRDKDDPYIFYAFIATQNDKMRQAVEAFDEIIENMPESEKAFELAKQGILANLSTQRTVRDNVLWSFVSAREMGVGVDRNKAVYDAVQGMTLADVKAFHDKWVKGRKYTYSILGDRNDIDMDYLRTLGPVHEVSQRELFGY